MKLFFSNIKNNHIDFLSIDIDGNDYWVLEKIDINNVNVLCSEYNPWIGNITQKVIPYSKDFTYEYDYYFGASLLSYVNLLNSKNFGLVAVDSSGTNAFYVKKNFLENFEILSSTNSFKKSSRFHSKIEASKIQDYVLNCKFIDLNNK